MNPTAFNFVQNVFALNLFSNLASDRKAPAPQLQGDLKKMLHALFTDANMQKYIGRWEVVWGPEVRSYGEDEKRQVASNALYVARNEAGQYVVATAGTNPISLYGWLTEDFDVRQMELWYDVAEAPDAPRISAGTSIGLKHLLDMKDGDKDLVTFLTDTFSGTTRQTQLVVTGHSLGGALSSVLALYLNQQLATWNPAETVVVSALPSAGATPGNKAFSDYFAEQIGARTLRFWNKLDPVPHGWQPDMVECMPFLYYPYLKPGTLLQAIVGLVLSQSLEGTAPYPDGGFYTQLQPQTPPLPGQVDIALTRPLPGATVLQFFVDMGAEEILKALNITNAFVTGLVIDVLNLILKEFAGQESLDELMDRLEHDLNKLPGKDSFLKKLLHLLEKLLPELQNIIQFLQQLGDQHVTVYADLMGTAPMHALSQSIINNAVKSGELHPDYLNVVDKLTDPARTLLWAPPRIGKMLLSVLTPDFLEKHGWMPDAI